MSPAARSSAARKVRVVDEDGADVDARLDSKVVEWRGEKFSIPAQIEDWPADAVLAFEEQKAMTAMKLILGPEQWETLRRISSGTVGEVSEVFELTAKAAGFESPGE